QKGILIGSVSIILLLAIALPFLLNSNQYVPLYNNLSAQEVAQIKDELDARGIPYEIKDGGNTITVPDEQVDSLLVDLAGEGIQVAVVLIIHFLVKMHHGELPIMSSIS